VIQVGHSQNAQCIIGIRQLVAVRIVGGDAPDSKVGTAKIQRHIAIIRRPHFQLHGLSVVIAGDLIATLQLSGMSRRRRRGTGTRILRWIR